MPIPSAPQHQPRRGELVADAGNNNIHGLYMDTLDGEAYLRPLQGGVEWTTSPANLRPVPHPLPARPAQPAVRRSKPRDANSVQLASS
ncbi:hypothetical protein ACFYNO_40560 [Kitasatospora sp. NPDC006697]|uniref:hypothetical protein n=1 Tax=Kitasatospora sp. NPDC006697 TaxID=3364020 RepID=UPI00368AE13B